MQQLDKGRKRFSLKLYGLGRTTNLGRVLFDLPPAPRLYEKDTADYAVIAPSTYYVSAGLVRSAALSVVRKREPALAELLTKLFAIADRWHAGELEELTH